MKGILKYAFPRSGRIGSDQGRTIRCAAQDDCPQLGVSLLVCGRGIVVAMLTLPGSAAVGPPFHTHWIRLA